MTFLLAIFYKTPTDYVMIVSVFNKATFSYSPVYKNFLYGHFFVRVNSLSVGPTNLKSRSFSFKFFRVFMYNSYIEEFLTIERIFIFNFFFYHYIFKKLYTACSFVALLHHQTE